MEKTISETAAECQRAVPKDHKWKAIDALQDSIRERKSFNIIEIVRRTPMLNINQASPETYSHTEKIMKIEALQ